MDEFKLDKTISKAIVDGTLKGYLQYLEERKSKKETMNVSGAYAGQKEIISMTKFLKLDK